MGRSVSVDGVTGAIHTFIVEPFVPHDAEFYLSLQSTRAGIDISFSDAGGVDIEDNWDRLKTVALPTGAAADAAALAPLLAALPLEQRPGMAAFVGGCVAVFEDLDFTLMVGRERERGEEGKEGRSRRRKTRPTTPTITLPPFSS
jgi:ATP citrate (pro-S)-lyase